MLVLYKCIQCSGNNTEPKSNKKSAVTSLVKWEPRTQSLSNLQLRMRGEERSITELSALSPGVKVSRSRGIYSQSTETLAEVKLGLFLEVFPLLKIYLVVAE